MSGLDTVIFKRPKKLESMLMKYEDMFQVESEVADDLVYGFGDGYIALIRSDGMCRCKTSRFETLRASLKEEIADEVTLIVETFPNVLRGREKN